MDKGKTKDQVEELMRNQTFILEAVRNLNERLEMIEQNYDVEKMNEIQEILDSQAVIDEVIVKNSDDIANMKKSKDENGDLIKSLDAKIDLLDTEIKRRENELELFTEIDNEQTENNKICRFYNRWYCKRKTLCSFTHPKQICTNYLKEGKCNVETCSSRQVLAKRLLLQRRSMRIQS